MDVEEFLPLPSLSEASELLMEDHLKRVSHPPHTHTHTHTHTSISYIESVLYIVLVQSSTFGLTVPFDLCLQLVGILPSSAVDHDWVLVYSTFRDGISLRTMYRNMYRFENEDTPVVLVVRDDQDKVSGMCT